MTASFTNAAGAQFLACCGAMARREQPALRLSEGDVEAFLELMDRHGIIPTIPAPSAGADHRPEALLHGWRKRCLVAAAGRRVAEQELVELAAGLGGAGVPVIALKGSAAVRWLYDADEGRWLGDLDLLVPESSVDQASRTLEQLGYWTGVPEESPAEVARRLRRSHLRRYKRSDRLPIELHVQFLKGSGNSGVAVADAWVEAQASESDTDEMRLLSAEHFFLHTAAHYVRDLERCGFARLKGLVDLLMVAERQQPPDWETLWRTARRWGVLREAATVAATLNDCWSTGIPVPPGYAPLLRQVLLTGETHSGEHATALRAFRLRAVCRVPGFGRRTGALIRLVFPHPRDFRQANCLPHGVPLLPHYLRRLAALPGRAVSAGGWIAWRALLRRL